VLKGAEYGTEYGDRRDVPHFPIARFIRGAGRQTATATYAHPGCGRSAEDGSSRVPLPCGRTPRPFAVRVVRGPHSTPPTVRAGPTPTVAGCSRAAPERLLPKGSHLAARNPGAPPIRPDPTTLRPRPDLPACFAIATPSPAPRPPGALRSRPGAPHIAHFVMCGFLRDRAASEITIAIPLVGSPTVV